MWLRGVHIAAWVILSFFTHFANSLFKFMLSVLKNGDRRCYFHYTGCSIWVGGVHIDRGSNRAQGRTRRKWHLTKSLQCAHPEQKNACKHEATRSATRCAATPQKGLCTHTSTSPRQSVASAGGRLACWLLRQSSVARGLLGAVGRAGRWQTLMCVGNKQSAAGTHGLF